MKIIQLNTWGGKFGQQIIDFLIAENPDFVCMQEVHDLKGKSGIKFFATLGEIKNSVGFKESFMSPTYSFCYMQRNNDYGNAVLSKFPLESTQTIFTNGQYKEDYDVTKDNSNIRNLQIVTTKIKDKNLTILNHHGYWIKKNKLGDKETERQMKLISDTVKDIDGPIIMAGDFNLTPDSHSLSLLDTELINLSKMYKLKSTYTQFGHPNTVCDYIFVNDQIDVESFKASEEILSDHTALILEFNIT